MKWKTRYIAGKWYIMYLSVQQSVTETHNSTENAETNTKSPHE